MDEVHVGPCAWETTWYKLGGSDEDGRRRALLVDGHFRGSVGFQANQPLTLVGG